MSYNHSERFEELDDVHIARIERAHTANREFYGKSSSYVLSSSAIEEVHASAVQSQCHDAYNVEDEGATQATQAGERGGSRLSPHPPCKAGVGGDASRVVWVWELYGSLIFLR